VVHLKRLQRTQPQLALHTRKGLEHRRRGRAPREVGQQVAVQQEMEGQGHLGAAGEGSEEGGIVHRSGRAAVLGTMCVCVRVRVCVC